MNICKICGKEINLTNPLILCNYCNSENNRLLISKHLIDSTILVFNVSSKGIEEYINSFATNKEKGDEIISLCSSMNSPLSQYYIARAYQLKGAKFRKEQITYSNKAISTQYDFKEHDYIYLLNLLAEAYEGEYMFDEAIKTYNLLLSKYCNYSPAKVKISRIMVKQNSIDAAIEYLEKVYEDVKSTPYYYDNPLTNKMELDPSYLSDLRCFPIDIAKLKEKKAKGYIYKPRKRKI